MNAPSLADGFDGCVQARRDSSLKRTGNLSTRASAHPVEDDALEQRPEVEHIVDIGEWIFIAGRCAVSELLEPDGSLSFECRLSYKAEQSRARIEESTHGCGGKRAHTSMDELQRVLITGAEVERRGGQVRKAI